MATATRNTELIPQSEIDVLIRYNKELVVTKDNLGAIIPVLHNAAMGVETFGGEYKELAQILKSFVQTQKNVEKEVNAHRNALSNVEKASRQLAYAQSQEAKELAVVKEQLRQKNMELRTNAKEALGAENSLGILRAQLIKLKSEAASLDIDSSTFTEASVKIRELNDRILQAEASMGDHRRNVGNYASGFNNLQFQVQQVARELPSLTVSVQQFFLAISNNIPMLTNAYAAARRENQKLREENLKMAAAQQKKVVPAWKQVVKSIGSWQTIVVVAITLLTAYGKEIGEFITRLFKGRKEIDAFKFSQGQLSKAMTDGAADAQKEIVRLKLLYEAATDVTRSMEERLGATQELQSMYPSYLGNIAQEKILAGEAKDAYEALMLAILDVAKARAAENLITENSEQALRIQMDDRYKDVEKLVEEKERITQEYDDLKKRIESLDPSQRTGQTYLDMVNQFNAILRRLRAINRKIARISKDIADDLSLPDDAKASVHDYINALDQSNIKLQEQINTINLSKDATDVSAGSIAKLREEISALTQRMENVDLSTADGESLMRSLQSQLDAKRAELVALEEMYGLTSAGGGGGGSGGSSAFSGLSKQRQAELELLKVQAQQEAEVQRRIVEDEKASYQDRLLALERFKEAQERVLSVEYGGQYEELDARLAGGDIDTATYEAVLRSLSEAEMYALDDLRANQEEVGQKLMESIGKGMIEQVQQAAEESSRKLDDEMRARLLSASEMYANGDIDDKQYSAAKREIADDTQRKRFASEISILHELLTTEEITDEQREGLAAKLAEAKVKYDEYVLNEQIRINEEIRKNADEDAKREEERQKRLKELKMQLLEEVFNFASALSDAQLEKEQNRLDKLSEANEKWKNEEVERIERLAEQGVISEEQSDARKKAIEEQAAVREEEIERQRIAAERRNAIFQKAQSVAQAAINVALAITAALTSPFTSAATIPLIAAAGAAQIATILATPIPEYAKGTKDHPGGLAVVGDGGRSELVIMPDRTVWRTPATDTVVDLPKHAQVLPDYDAVLAQFAIPRLSNMPSDMSRVEMLLEEEKLRQGAMLEKSTERNRLLKLIVEGSGSEKRLSSMKYIVVTSRFENHLN